MPTIAPRVIKGHTYYYAVKSGRVKGKSRLVWQKYLGTADDIIRCGDKNRQPLKAKTVNIFRFGAEAAQRLGIIDIIDRFVPKRDQGVTPLESICSLPLSTEDLILLKTVLLMMDKAQGRLKALQERFRLWQKGIYRRGRAPTSAIGKKASQGNSQGTVYEETY